MIFCKSSVHVEHQSLNIFFVMIFKVANTKPPKLLDSKDRNAIAAEMIGILYDNALRTNLVVIAAVLIILGLFQNTLHSGSLFAWSIGMSFSALYRLHLLYSFRSKKDRQDRTKTFEKQYVFATLAVAIFWTSLIAWGVFLPDFEHRIFFILILVSLLGASVPALSTSLKAMYIYILLPSTVTVPILFFHGGADAPLGIAVIIYVLMMVKSGQYMHNSVLASITLKYNQRFLNNNLEHTVKVRTEELERAKDMSEKANKAKSVFLANMSHEIRTPMNVIINLSQLAMTEKMSPKAQEFITNVNRAGKNLLGIINDILDFSKIESGSFSIDYIHFDMIKLLDEIREEFEYIAIEKDIGFSVTVDDNFFGKYTGDPLRIRQILTNIISNGIKFTEKGDVVLSISETEIGPEEMLVEMIIVDSGIGISLEQQAKLFQPFKQADESTTRKYGGSGLGLVISKQLAELMGGKLLVKSQPNIGSQFTIILPLKTAPENFDSIETSTQANSSKQQPAVDEIKVLIVDDIPANQLILEMLLSNRNITTLSANNGQEALDILEKNEINLVFMDIQMPIMDGYEATQEIRAIPRLSTLPVIAMTANALPEDIQKCYDQGMDACIVKPIDINDVNEALNTHLAMPDKITS